MSERMKKTLIVQGSILAIAGIVSRMIGFIYRIPMANIMGNTGNGLYSVAFGIYNISLTLSSYSMPLAISKLMSERLAKSENKNARKVFKTALFMAFILGLIACIIIFLSADLFAVWYQKDGLERPLRVLAITTLVVALLGSFRGYYQGQSNMIPSAVSQILEQIVNAIVSVIATWYLVSLYKNTPEEASFGAAGGTLGTLAGALAAFVFFVILFWRDRKREKNTNILIREEKIEEQRIIVKAILFTVIPVILSQTVYQIGYTIDDNLFANLMKWKGFHATYVTDVQGVFNTQYNQLINLPVAIATAMAASTIPSIVASNSVGAKGEVFQKIRSVIKINMVIAIPSAFGLAVLAEPLMTLLFPALGKYHDMAVLMLQMGSSAVVFYALSTITTAILQGSNYMKLPVIHCAISLVLHVIIVWGFTIYTDYGVYSLIIGNVTFPFFVCCLNCCAIAKKMACQPEWMNAFGKPIIAAAVMAISIFYTQEVLDQYITMPMLTLIVTIIIGVILYFIFLFGLKSFSEEEIDKSPLGKFLKKIR